MKPEPVVGFCSLFWLDRAKKTISCLIRTEELLTTVETCWLRKSYIAYEHKTKEFARSWPSNLNLCLLL